MKRIVLSLASLMLLWNCSNDDDNSNGNNNVEELNPSLEFLGELAFAANVDDQEDISEISAYDPITKRLFTTNGNDNLIWVSDLSDPANPQKISEINLAPYGGGPNSVDVLNGKLAVSVEANTKTDNGQVVVFNTDDYSLSNQYQVGPLPDMLVYTPDGSKIVVANEGEPNDEYTIDPNGSVSIIDLNSGMVSTLDFTNYNGQEATLRQQGVRIFGNNGLSSVAQDLEPEYVAISDDSSMAYVTLQENNAVAVVNLNTNTITSLLPLGTKDYSTAAYDFSNRDGENESELIDLKSGQNVIGFYMPDAIAYYGGYLFTANEGDARDYDGYSEEERVKDLELDPTAYPNASELQEDFNLGRLKTTTANGDTDGDGDFDQFYAYGGRSFSVWSTSGALMFDSGNDLDSRAVEMGIYDDGRSDDKGVEPEAITVAQFGNKAYALVGVERTTSSVVFVYDITTPTSPVYVGALRSNDHISPEGVLFIPQNDGPNGEALVVVTHEVAGNLSIYKF